MNRLRQMSIFAHIVEAGSISKAADKLMLSKSVVSQHLKALEQELAVSLIKRTTRKQTLTEAGSRFYANCKELNSIADSAWEQAQEFQAVPQGRVRITAPHALMDCFVAPVIADLMLQYPKLEPVLVSEDLHMDLMAHDIDLAVRVGTSPDSNFKQKRIGEFRDVLCGTSDKQALNLSEQPYIANAWQGDVINHQFMQSNGEVLNFSTKAKCITNSIHSCAALIKAGSGIGILPDFYLQQFEPQLVDLMPQGQLARNMIYALNPFGEKPPLTVKICIAALQHHLTEVP